MNAGYSDIFDNKILSVSYEFIWPINDLCTNSGFYVDALQQLTVSLIQWGGNLVVGKFAVFLFSPLSLKLLIHTVWLMFLKGMLMLTSSGCDSISQPPRITAWVYHISCFFSHFISSDMTADPLHNNTQFELGEVSNTCKSIQPSAFHKSRLFPEHRLVNQLARNYNKT